MAKHIAGKTVKFGNHTHYDEGQELPALVPVQVFNKEKQQHEIQKLPIEKLPNYEQCLKDGTFKLVDGKEPSPLQLPTLKEWLAAGHGKDLSPEDQRNEHTEVLKGLREDAKKQGRRVIEPGK